MDFDRQAVVDALLTYALHNTETTRKAVFEKFPRACKLASIPLFTETTQWEAIDRLDEDAREHYFARLRRDGAEGEQIIETYERIQRKDGVTVKVSNCEDDPFMVQFEVSDEIADAWADAHGSLCGGTWETADGTDFVYDSGVWYEGLFDELKAEGFNLDFSEWSDPEEEDFAIAKHWHECPQCEGTDFERAKKHMKGEAA